MADEIVVASAVDELPSAYVHIYIDLQFDDLQQEVLARPNLSSKERARFEREAKTTCIDFDRIAGWAAEQAIDRNAVVAGAQVP